MATRRDRIRTQLCVVCSLAAGVASAQAQTLVYEQTHDGTATDNESRPTSASVGVSDKAGVAIGTRYMGLYSKGGSLQDFRTAAGMGFPFDLVDPDFNVLIDARAEHDQVHNRLVMAYMEAQAGFLSFAVDPCADDALLHLAISRDLPSVTSFSNWWYYTGGGPGGSTAFDLGASGYLQYKNEFGAHEPVEKTARMPSLGFHSRSGDSDDRSGAIIVAVNGRLAEDCPLPPASAGADAPEVTGKTRQHLYIIPYEHEDGEESILDGDQPQPGDITTVRPFTQDVDSDIAPDTSIYGWVVQEPYGRFQNAEFVENATFIISTPLPGSADTPVQEIRLKGLFFDDTQNPGEEWTLQQRVVATSSKTLDPIVIDSSLRYRPTNETGDNPVPASEIDTPSGFWGPAGQGTYFHSAVLVKDNGPQGGEYRIFAVHSVRPEGQDRWVAQWYVIDPALATFHSTPAPSGNWKPTVVASGRLESTGNSYHPNIVVSRQGIAFIEYTYSDSQTWPEVRRVRLNNSYNGIATGPTLIKAGPSLSYDENTNAFPDFGIWANIADAQADAFDQCFYWSTHTLVNDDPVLNPTPTRDAWLFQNAFGNTPSGCGQSLALVDLNDDGQADAFDLVAFTDRYAQEARRVDFNADGKVCPADTLLFMDAYAAETSR
ncbi:MAG: hypothetical protein AAFV77_00075 [Planctomycetota bacterium]